MFIHKRVKQLRKQMGISRDQLMINLAGEGARASMPTIANWENGKSTPDANGLIALARVFNKPLVYFFDQNHK